MDFFFFFFAQGWKATWAEYDKSHRILKMQRGLFHDDKVMMDSIKGGLVGDHFGGWDGNLKGIGAWEFNAASIS